ncbi:hypothetical protein GN244_ATG08151 [Phytophthora infestans]|uniref:Uncharacterized protein n=1 Tax=Phytophthora infestans TaxID=4787 RepID=A0A833SVM4_PHYIN|nr:hypothetical protein GN244_ATG08151 [Phytophthora infestans]
MYFFLVLENVKKRLSGLSNNTKHLVYRYIYEMHYSRYASEYGEIVAKADSVWRAVPELGLFADYCSEDLA